MKTVIKYSYAREKLYTAILTLSTGRGDVRSRLLEAFAGFCPLKSEDFPKEYRKEWELVIEELEKAGPVKDSQGKLLCGSVENTMKRIRNSAGEKIAEKIFKIGWALHMDAKHF